MRPYRLCCLSCSIFGFLLKPVCLFKVLTMDYFDTHENLIGSLRYPLLGSYKTNLLISI